jgi:hypothetical protein
MSRSLAVSRLWKNDHRFVSNPAEARAMATRLAAQCVFAVLSDELGDHAGPARLVART